MTIEASTNMQKQQLRPSSVLNTNILNLFDQVKRDEFVPTAYKHVAYSDYRIPLQHQQAMLTPSEEGTILQALALQGHETVLEIGTGSGFLTAMLSHLAKQIISVEYFADMTQAAQKKLDAHDRTNVTLITANGAHGYFDQAPYDAIVVTGTLETISEGLKLQVLPGGKLFVIQGTAPIMRGMLYTLSKTNEWSESLLFETYTPPLIDQSKPHDFVF